jgi:hypothetical protein
MLATTARSSGAPENCRNQQAIQRKLNAIADGLADLMEQLAEERPDLNEDLKELRAAVGLEQHEGTGPPKR